MTQEQKGVTAIVNGKTHVIITVTLVGVSIIKKTLDKAEKLGGIFKENRLEYIGGWLFGKTVHVITVLIPEDKVYEFQKDA